MRTFDRGHVFGLAIVFALLASAHTVVVAQEDNRVDHVGVVTMSELRKEISTHPYVVAMLYVVPIHCKESEFPNNHVRLLALMLSLLHLSSNSHLMSILLF